MKARQTFYALLGLTVLTFVAFLGGAYEINALLGKQSVTLANLKAQTQSLQQQQVGLKKAKQDIAKYSGLEKITQQIVPQDKDQAEAVREILNIASGAGVTLTGINFPASTLGSTTAPAAGASSAAAASTSPSAALSAKPSLSQLTPVPNIPGVYQLQITLQNDNDTEVSYPKFYNFLAGLENNRRTAEVSSIIIQPDANNRSVLTFVLTLNEYIKP